MSTARQQLGRLARLYGIERSYKDIWQRRHVVPAATERALLAAMGVAAANAQEVESSLALAEEPAWRSPLPPVIVTRRPGLCATLTLPERTSGPVAWSVVTEAGETVGGETLPAALEVVASGTCRDTTYRRYRLPLPELPPGYHRLDLSSGATTSLIVAPRRAYGPDPDARLWGVTAPLYGVRSATNWGVGDFADLGRLAATCGKLGAAFVGINPIHAQLPAAPGHYSPYSPSSRRFLNVLLIAIDRVPELERCAKAQALLASPACQAHLEALRNATMIDYPAVASLKLEILALLFASLAQGPGPRCRAFEAFQRQSGPSLLRQALFDALHEHFLTRDPACTTWRAWPEPYHDPASAEVARFAARHRKRVGFFAYLQWLAHEQLEQAQTQATAHMKLGLYLDLAVGVTPDGAEAWAHRDSIVEGASLGAPPDEFNHAGQNWGLAPLSPHGLRKDAYAPLIAILRSGMRHAGILRIDHILGLQRSFWWPAERGVAGTYVRQPVEDLLGVVALESHRQRCMVVGEDLGTVPAGLRRKLEATGVLGCSVLYFERCDGGFLPAARYRPGSIASIGTHDLPTLAGFWAGRDIDWRAKLGLYKNPQQVMEARRERQRERAALLRLLDAEGLLPPGSKPDDELTWPLVLAFHRLLARSPAKLMAFQIEDALGAIEQANLPGTTSEHPNWCRRLDRTLEALDRSRPLRELGDTIDAERPRSLPDRGPS